MPANRFLNPALGHSEKITLLTDLEFRVWTQYLLSADDFGVMRLSAVTVQADNDALHSRPAKTIQRALERLVDLGLVVDFEHQRRKYICQLDWHRWQRFNMPSPQTINPAPPPEVMARCDERTRELFRDYHPMLVEAASTGVVDATSTQSVTETVDSDLITTNGIRPTALSTGLRERFAIFWKEYPRKVGKDAAWRSWQKVRPDGDCLNLMRSVLEWQRKTDQWILDGGKFIPHPATWLNQGRWHDEPPEQLHVSERTLKTARAVEEFVKP